MMTTGLGWCERLSVDHVSLGLWSELPKSTRTGVGEMLALGTPPLANHVGICDIEVMVSDVGAAARPNGGNFFPPSVSAVPAVPALATPSVMQAGPTLAQRVAAVAGLSRAELRSADATAMSATLLGLWAAMTNRPAHELVAGDMHPDGSVRISSQVAVWLIGRISEAYGRRKLVNLSRVKDVESLRSLGGLTGLLRAVIGADTEGTLV